MIALKLSPLISLVRRYTTKKQIRLKNNRSYLLKNKKHTLRYHRKGPYIYIRQPFIKDFMASTKTTVDQLAQHANVSTKHMYAVLNNTKHVGTHVLRAFQKLFADFDEDEVFYTTNAPGTQSGKTYQLQHGFKKSWKQQWQKRQ